MSSRVLLVASYLIACQLVFSLPVAAKSDFFKQRYRGWLWFDIPEAEEKIVRSEQQLPSPELMQQAKRENEEFSQELELLKNLMVRYPENLTYIKLYKLKEKLMMERAMKLGNNWQLVNFLNPEINDELENPQNIYGRDLKKRQQQVEGEQILAQIAQEIELFVFRQEDCVYCDTLEKHLAYLAGEYGFKVEAVTADASRSKYFQSYNSPSLVQALGLNTMPTVIAVVNKTRQRFELARGAVSVADLKNKALLLAKYLTLASQQQNQQARLEGRSEERTQEAIIESVPQLEVDIRQLKSVSEVKGKGVDENVK